MATPSSENEKSSLPVDRGWAWVIVVAQFVNVFLMVGLAKSMGIFMEAFKHYFDTTTALASMVMAAAAVVYAFVGPICLLLGERFGARPIVMFGGFVGCLGISLSSLLVSMDYVIIFFGIGFGIGNSTIYGNGLVMLGTYFLKRRTLANGLALSGSSLGQFAIPPIIQFLLDNFGLSGAVLLIGGLYFHITLFASFFRPMSYYTSLLAKRESRMDGSKTEKLLGENNKNSTDLDGLVITVGGHEDEDGSIEKIDNDKRYTSFMASTGSICLTPVETQQIIPDENHLEPVTDKKQNFCTSLFDLSILRNYICIFNVLFGFISFFGYFNFILFLPSHAISVGIRKYEMTWLVSACGIGDLCGRLFLGYFGDLNLIQRYKLETFCLMSVGINTLLFAFANNFWWMLVHSVFYGLFGGGYVCMTAVVLIDMMGLKLMPKMLAILLLVQGIGAALGQPFLGWIYDRTGTYQVVMLICGAACVLSSLILACWPIVKRLELQRVNRLKAASLVQTQQLIHN